MTGLAVGTAVGLWLVVAVETVRVAQGRGSRALWVAVLGLAVSRTLDLDAVAGAFGHAVTVSVAERMAVLVSAVGVVVVTRSIAREGGRRPGRALAVATDPRLWVVVGLLILAPLVHAGQALPSDTAGRAATYAADPWWGVHWVTFLVFLGFVLWQGASISLRNARHVPGILRWRLVGLGVGQGFAVAYAVLKGVRLAVLAADGPAAADDVLGAAEQGALAASVATVAVSLLAGAVGTMWDGLLLRRRVWTLWPLWVGLWDHAPHMPFPAPPRRWVATVIGDVRMTAVRQVVELGDAIRVLTPYLPPHDPTDPAARAAALAEAAGRRSAGSSPLGDHHEPEPMGSTVDERATHLVPVARRWRRSAASAPLDRATSSA